MMYIYIINLWHFKNGKNTYKDFLISDKNLAQMVEGNLVENHVMEGQVIDIMYHMETIYDGIV